MRRLSSVLALVTGIVSSAAVIFVAERFADGRAVRARSRIDDGIVRAVILGDSVARGAGDERGAGIAGYLADELRSRRTSAVDVLNFGINGARSGNVLKLLAQPGVQSAVRAADIVIVSIGGNDLYGDSRVRLLAALAPDHHQDFTVRKVAALMTAVRRLNPAARFYLLGLYNPYRHAKIARWLDQQVDRWDARLIDRFATWQQVTVVRIVDLLARSDRLSATDRFHPGSAGYAAIARRIASSL